MSHIAGLIVTTGLLTAAYVALVATVDNSSKENRKDDLHPRRPH